MQRRWVGNAPTYLLPFTRVNDSFTPLLFKMVSRKIRGTIRLVLCFEFVSAKANMIQYIYQVPVG